MHHLLDLGTIVGEDWGCGRRLGQAGLGGSGLPEAAKFGWEGWRQGCHVALEDGQLGWLDGGDHQRIGQHTWRPWLIDR